MKAQEDGSVEVVLVHSQRTVNRHEPHLHVFHDAMKPLRNRVAAKARNHVMATL